MLASALAAVSAALAGCASNYVPPAGKPMARLAFQVDTTSTGKLSHTVGIYAFGDLYCAPYAYGTRLHSRLRAENREAFQAVEVPAGEPFTFGIRYGEARAAQTRTCSYTAQFTPAPGGSYLAKMAVVNDVASCVLTIEDVAAAPAASLPFETVPLSCIQTSRGKVRNGVPFIVTTEFEIVREPASRKGK